ncbi:TPA: hypothetical protein ACH3X3_008333 [Trebouxia sp. C0006]
MQDLPLQVHMCCIVHRSEVLSIHIAQCAADGWRVLDQLFIFKANTLHYDFSRCSTKATSTLHKSMQGGNDDHSRRLVTRSYCPHLRSAAGHSARSIYTLPTPEQNHQMWSCWWD